MAFISLSGIKKDQSTRNGGLRSKSELAISVCNGSKLKSGHKTKVLNFRLADSLINRARFMVGDRLDVLFDKTNGIGMIKRDNQGSMTLSRNSKNASSTRLTLTLRKGMPAVRNTFGCDSVEVDTDGTIQFKLPDDYYIYGEDVKEDLKLVHRI